MRRNPAFAAVSTYNDRTLADFAGRATKNVPGREGDGTKVSNVGKVAVPRASVGVIPEPSPMLLCGLGLLGMAAFKLHRRS